MRAALIALISGLIMTFSVQNTQPVTVSLLFREAEISLTWITIAAVFSGVFLAQLLRAAMAKRHPGRNVEILNRRHRW